MSKMRLIFNDENGKPRVELVEKDKFIIGRHSECDLCVRLSELSRKHLQIERFGAVFVVSDLGSSNGTTLNGEKLGEPVALKNGDVLNCGGVLELKVEINEDFSDNGESKEDKSKDSNSQFGSVSSGQVNFASESIGFESTEQKEKQSAVLSAFIIAPILGLFVLAIVGLLFVFTGEKKKSSDNAPLPRRWNESSGKQTKGGFDEKVELTDISSRGVDENSKIDGKHESLSSNVESINEDSAKGKLSEVDEKQARLEKVERYAVLFARQIAFHDANYAFTKKQIEEISARVADFSGSTALANNLKAVKRNSYQLGQIAKRQGLKPQFLAIVVAAQLGKKQGDVLQKAREILPLLGELKISLGNELADDNLLIVAALDQLQRGGDRLAMRKTVEALSNQPGIDAKKARTVWFLHEKGKLLDSQYEAVLTFLAIGAIAQNPSEFNLEAEPLVFH